MFVVDTNILLYAANSDFNEHTKAAALIENWRKNSSVWYVTYGIVYEFLRVVTHHRVFDSPWSIGEAWEFIDTLLSTPGVTLLMETEQHLKTAAEVIKTVRHLSGNLVFDAHTAIIMKENGIRTIYTRDSDFHKFPFVEVIDPFKSID